MSDELDTIVAADNDKYMIRCENLVKIYKTSDVEVVALQGLDLDVERGELMAIVGNSGSGKSTLLNMLGGLDKPSAGNLYVDGKDLLKFTDKDYMEYKRNTVGFVWQNNAEILCRILRLCRMSSFLCCSTASIKDGRKHWSCLTEWDC